MGCLCLHCCVNTTSVNDINFVTITSCCTSTYPGIYGHATGSFEFTFEDGLHLSRFHCELSLLPLKLSIPFKMEWMGQEFGPKKLLCTCKGSRKVHVAQLLTGVSTAELHVLQKK